MHIIKNKPSFCLCILIILLRYDSKTKVLNLIDFGAAREYSKNFTDEYIQLVYACAKRHDKFIFKHSDKLGFTTGDETRRLKSLHAKSGYVLGEPFRTDKYDFGNNRMVNNLTNYGSEILSDRLTPPPSEAYTLHRKVFKFINIFTYILNF